MPEETPQGEEQRTMLSFTEAADRLVADGIAQSMTAEGLRKLARDPASGWPIGPDDYRVVGKTRMLPYELLVPYMKARRPGRGPAKQPRKKRDKAADVSGQRNSGMSREDYEARERLLDAAELIERRWLGEYSALCRDLRDLGDTISEESEAQDG
ncbi:hypothetical protein [Streptomyces sp. SID8352]|uniref:hypothetical protein n=1 Tax=Streptomyces sp. SID8352 TaxID=2690338 RepID=UPI00136C9C00|nr:hypothetical protein [Streptomyces sp. SID8352]MYU22930.1 hypothetical protein [Streptomyces sp. SID8352]